jgi:hypothetical protein
MPLIDGSSRQSGFDIRWAAAAFNTGRPMIIPGWRVTDIRHGQYWLLLLLLLLLLLFLLFLLFLLLSLLSFQNRQNKNGGEQGSASMGPQWCMSQCLLQRTLPLACAE